MLAVLWVETEEIKNIIKENFESIKCYLANDNSNGQIILSGKIKYNPPPLAANYSAPYDIISKIPKEILNIWNQNCSRELVTRKSWEKSFSNSSYFKEINDLIENKHVSNIEHLLESYKENLSKDSISLATRKSSENVLNELTTKLSNLIGGSADLTGSKNPLAKRQNEISAKAFSGSYI